MAFNPSLSCLFFFFLLTFVSCSVSSFISYDVLQSHESTGRALLQTKKSCPVNFEFLNYTIITSQCKGPQYPAKQCCGALKEFACPVSVELNDLTNDCASTMFSYINLYGKYPPGLFSSECKEGKDGLQCIADAPSSTSAKDTANASRGQMVSSFSLMTLAAAFLVLLCHLF